MEIKLLKPYLNHTAGETIEVTATRGGYLIKTKQAKPVFELELITNKVKGEKIKEPFRKAGRKTKR